MTPDKRNQFVRASTRYGGALSTEEVTPNTLFDVVRRNMRAYKKSLGGENILFDYLRRTDGNAIAWSDSNGEYVGATLGLMSAITYILCGVLNHPRCLPSIGNPSLEVEGTTGFLRNVTVLNGDWASEMWDPSTPGKSRIISPRCPYRYNAWLWIYQCAANFLIGHEVAHIMRGHLLLLDGCTLHEGGSSRPKNSSWALEVDADRVAFQLLYDFVTRNAFYWVERGSGTRPWDPEPMVKHQFLTLAVGLIFFLFTSGSSQGGTSSHPDPISRISYLLFIQSRLGAPIERLEEMAKELIEALIILEFPMPQNDGAYPTIGECFETLRSIRDERLPEIMDACRNRARLRGDAAGEGA